MQAKATMLASARAARPVFWAVRVASPNAATTSRMGMSIRVRGSCRAAPGHEREPRGGTEAEEMEQQLVARIPQGAVPAHVDEGRQPGGKRRAARRAGELRPSSVPGDAAGHERERVLELCPSVRSQPRDGGQVPSERVEQVVVTDPAELQLNRAEPAAHRVAPRTTVTSSSESVPILRPSTTTGRSRRSWARPTNSMSGAPARRRSTSSRAADGGQAAGSGSSGAFASISGRRCISADGRLGGPLERHERSGHALHAAGAEAAGPGGCREAAIGSVEVPIGLVVHHGGAEKGRPEAFRVGERSERRRRGGVLELDLQRVVTHSAPTRDARHPRPPRAAPAAPAPPRRRPRRGSRAGSRRCRPP